MSITQRIRNWTDQLWNQENCRPSRRRRIRFPTNSRSRRRQGSGYACPRVIAGSDELESRILLTSISGTKWHDLNANDYPDTDFMQGETFVFIVDVSQSTLEQFPGDVGDVNGDGAANTGLDAMLAGYIAATEFIIERGLGDTMQIGVVVFAAQSAALDMDSSVTGVQLFTTATADADGNEVSDVVQVLKSITAGHANVGNETNLEAPLRETINMLRTGNRPMGGSNVFMLVDGVHNTGTNPGDEADVLRNAGANLRAFFVGGDVDSTLRRIDPRAGRFTSAQQIIDEFGGGGQSNGVATANFQFREPNLPSWRIYLDLNGNGVLDDGEPTTLTDQQGRYSFNNLADGTYIVREVMQFGWIQTCPGPERNFQWTVEIVNGQAVDQVNFGNLELQSEPLYVSDNEGILGIVDVITSDVQIIGRMGVIMTDLAISTTGEFFGVSSTHLYRINPANAEVKEIGPLDIQGVTSLEFGPDNVLYAARSSSTLLYQIDTETGQASHVGSTGTPLSGGLAWTGEILYGAGPQKELVSVNLDPLRGTVVKTLFDENSLPVHTMEAGQIGLLAITGSTIWVVNPAIGGDIINNGTPYGGILGPARGAAIGNPVVLQPPVLRGTIRGTLWNDVNEDGVLDSGEDPHDAVQVYLDLNNNGRLDDQEPVTVTDQDGNYEFADLEEGDYAVRQILNLGDRQTYPQTYVGSGYAGTNQSQTRLVEIDPGTGDIHPVGNSAHNTRIHGLALTLGGQYIGSNFGTDAIYSIDPTSGLESVVGNTGVNLTGGMTYVAATDTIYVIGQEQGASVNRLMSVDPVSGAVTAIGPGIEGMQNTSGLAWDWDNEVFIAFDNFDSEFYEFDLQGNARKLSDAQFSLNSWSLAYNGTEFVMGNLSDQRQVVKVDPATGVWEEAFRLTDNIRLESLEFLGGVAAAHRVTITGDSLVENIDFGRVGPLRELVVTETGGDTVVSEEGTTDAFIVRLASEPLTDVVIDITSGDTTEVEILTQRITLTPDTWNSGKVVTLRGVDDAEIDGNFGSLVTVRVVDLLSDDAFDGESALVPVLTLDDDVPQTNTNIRGYIWRDDNRNGVQDNNEPPLTGAQVYLDANDNGHRDPGEKFIPTQEQGFYQFSNIAPGTYVVRQILSGPTFQSSPRLYVGMRLTGQGTQTSLYRMDTNGAVRVVGVPTDVPIDSLVMTRNSRIFGINQASNTFHSIDPNTGGSTLIGGLGPRVVTGLAYDPATDSIYAVGRPNQSSTLHQLLVVDRRTGVTTPVGQGIEGIQSTSGLTFDFAARRIILFDNVADSFYEFDTDGNAKELADASAPLDGQSLAFDGRQFTMQLRNPADERQLISVDPDSGVWQNSFRSSTGIATTALDYVSFGDFGQRVSVFFGQTVEDVNFGQFTIDPGFTVTETDGSTLVSESGITDSLNVILDRRPDFPVVVRVFTSDPSEVEINAATQTLVFTPNDWNIPHQVLLSGVNENEQDGPQTAQVTFRIDRILTDDAFDQVADQSVDVTILDDDTPGFTITKTSVVVSESGTSEQFSVFLNSQPASNVAIDIAISDSSEVDVTGQFLTFTRFNWNIPQTVTVTGVDDISVDGNRDSVLTVSVRDSASDDEYDPLPDQTVSVTTLDDDSIGLYVNKSQLTVSETGGTDNFTVVLTAEPLSNVVLKVANNRPDEVEVNITTLVYTPQNWFRPQQVILRGRSDDSLDGNQQAVISVNVDPDRSDDAYDNVEGRTLTVTNTDTNRAALTVNVGSLTVSENGTSRAFSVNLTAAPSSDVVFSVSSSDIGEAVVSPATLTFSPQNWNIGQTVTVTGVDDAPIDGDQSLTVSLTVDPALSDNSYDALPPTTIAVVNRDNDFAGFTLSKKTAIVHESGSRDAVYVVLNTVPSSNVVFNVGRQSHGEVVESPVRLTFTPDNWDFPQIITLTGVDDARDDGNQQTNVNIAIDALVSDDAWDELSLQTIVVTTIDDDDADLVPTVNGPTALQTPAQPVTLRWEAVPNALSYEVWLERIGGTDNPVANPTISRTDVTLTAGLDMGRYRTWVRANLGASQRTPWATGEFSVAAAPAIHPMPFHGNETRPRISWDPVPGATSYRVYINNVTLGQTALLDTIVSGPSLTPNFDFQFGVHRIWVRAITAAGNFRGPWSTATSYYLGPELLTPTLSTFDSQPEFTWTSVPGIATYQLYVQKGGTVVVNETDLTATTYSLAAPLDGGDYRWWVRPFAASGRGGAWSQLGEFNIGGRPRIQTPSGTLNDSVVTISWDEVVGAGSYEIYLFNDNGIGLVHRESNLTGTSFTTFPLPDGDYRVWLKSYKPDGSSGQWSRAQRFTVDAANINLTATPISPVAPTFDTTPIFRWSAEFGATTYDLYLTDGTTVIHRTSLTSTIWVPPGDLAAHQWRWWVRAKTSTGIGPWSAPATTDVSGRAVVVAPVGTTSDRTPTIIWTAVEGAGRYILQVDNLTTGQLSLIREDNLSVNTYTPGSDLTAGNYRAWVRAINGTSNEAAPWSLQRPFTIAQVESDSTVPPATIEELLALTSATQRTEKIDQPGRPVEEQNPTRRQMSVPGPAIYREFAGKKPVRPSADRSWHLFDWFSPIGRAEGDPKGDHLSSNDAEAGLIDAVLSAEFTTFPATADSGESIGI